MDEAVGIGGGPDGTGGGPLLEDLSSECRVCETLSDAAVCIWERIARAFSRL
jgi:hypothetical protein